MKITNKIWKGNIFYNFNQIWTSTNMFWKNQEQCLNMWKNWKLNIFLKLWPNFENKHFLAHQTFFINLNTIRQIMKNCWNSKKIKFEKINNFLNSEQYSKFQNNILKNNMNKDPKSLKNRKKGRKTVHEPLEVPQNPNE